MNRKLTDVGLAGDDTVPVEAVGSTELCGNVECVFIKRILANVFANAVAAVGQQVVGNLRKIVCSPDLTLVDELLNSDALSEVRREVAERADLVDERQIRPAWAKCSYCWSFVGVPLLAVLDVLINPGDAVLWFVCIAGCVR